MLMCVCVVYVCVCHFVYVFCLHESVVVYKWAWAYVMDNGIASAFMAGKYTVANLFFQKIYYINTQ